MSVKTFHASIARLIRSSQEFWKVAERGSFRPLAHPRDVPEFQEVMKAIEGVTLSSVIEDPDFLRRYKNKEETDCFEIYNDKRLVIMCLTLPEGFIYPVHDHPEMLVASKIIEGSVRIAKFDIAKKSQFYENFPPPLFGKVELLKSAEVLKKANEIDILLPGEQNLHSIEAVSRSVIIDTLFNFYDRKDRFCSFFEINRKIAENRFESTFWSEDQLKDDSR